MTRLLVSGVPMGWYEPFDDPLLEVRVLRVWLGAAALASEHLRFLSVNLANQLREAMEEMEPRPGLAAVESNRVFPLHGGEPASALLSFARRDVGCGECDWRNVGCDEWFVTQLVDSFILGCRRLGAEPAPERVQAWVDAELAAEPDLEWWALTVPDGDRCGVVASPGHYDLVDGTAYVQVVDAVGRHSAHVACLVAELGSRLRAEVRGEVTVGANWSRERGVLRSLHAEGWRVRGLTSVFRPVAGTEAWLGDSNHERR